MKSFIKGKSPLFAATKNGQDKKHYAVVEGVGLVGESIKQGCYTDSNNKLTVSNMGLFSDNNNTSSVDSYEFFGEITLVIDGREVETNTNKLR